jgi:hypothetical protein
MPLGNAHVEASVGHGLHHDVHRAAGGHGRCYPYNLGVLLSQFEERMAEDILELGRHPCGVIQDTLSGGGVELTRSVPDGGRLLGRFVALALHRVQMQQLGALHVLELPEQAHHLLDVVPVEGSEVADVHTLEDVLLMADGTLDGVVEPDDALATVVVEVALGMQPLRGLEAYLVVSLVGIEVSADTAPSRPRPGR